VRFHDIEELFLIGRLSCIYAAQLQGAWLGSFCS